MELRYGGADLLCVLLTRSWSPMLGLLGAFISGSEASSNLMFFGILKTSTDVLSLDFLQVYAVIAVAKIINAAAVINKRLE